MTKATCCVHVVAFAEVSCASYEFPNIANKISALLVCVTSLNVTMELLVIIWDAVKGFWNCSANGSSYIRHLEAKVDSLSQAKRVLDSSRKDVSGRVDRAIEADFLPRGQVNDWLTVGFKIILDPK